MASLLARATQLIFGATGGASEFGQIGSQSAGSPVTSKDLATIQALNKYLLGLYSITVNGAQPPFIEDLNALYFLITSQLAYIFQAGIPEYDSGTNYFNNISYVQVNGVIYQSISGTDPSPNVGNPPASSPSNWRKLIDTDSAFTTNSDFVVPSQKAVKTAIDAETAARISAVTTLTANLNAEITRATNAENVLTANTKLTFQISNPLTSSSDVTDTLSPMSVGEERQFTLSITFDSGSRIYTLNLPALGTYTYSGFVSTITGSTGGIAAVADTAQGGGGNVYTSIPCGAARGTIRVKRVS